MRTSFTPFFSAQPHPSPDPDSLSCLRQSRDPGSPVAKLQMSPAITGRYSQVGRRWGAGAAGGANRCAGSAPSMPHSWGGATSGRVAGRGGWGEAAVG